MTDIKEQRKSCYYRAKEELEDRNKLASDVLEAMMEVQRMPIHEIEQEIYIQLLTITDEETAGILCDKVEDSYTVPEVELPYYIQVYIEAAEKNLEKAKQLYIEVLDNPEEEEVDFWNEECVNMDIAFPNDGWLGKMK